MYFLGVKVIQVYVSRHYFSLCIKMHRILLT